METKKVTEDVFDAILENAQRGGYLEFKLTLLRFQPSSKGHSFTQVTQAIDADYLVGENYYGHIILELKNGVPVYKLEYK